MMKSFRVSEKRLAFLFTFQVSSNCLKRLLAIFPFEKKLILWSWSGKEDNLYTCPGLFCDQSGQYINGFLPRCKQKLSGGNIKPLICTDYCRNLNPSFRRFWNNIPQRKQSNISFYIRRDGFCNNQCTYKLFIQNKWLSLIAILFFYFCSFCFEMKPSILILWNILQK